MSIDSFELPERPFFSCDAEGFTVVDGALMRSASSIISIEPLIALRVGPGNVFEQRPRKVLDRQGDVVKVACDDGTIVFLDFGDFAARRESAEGESIYRGGLDEGNGGKGWMPVR